jgi:uncharacterized protein involved in outer membrane biogenesis
MFVWMRRLSWCVVAFVLLCVISWLALPALIKWQLPLRAGEALGRSVTLGEVAFNPLKLDLVLNDLSIAGSAPSTEPLLKVKRVHADLSISSLYRRAPVIQALEIDEPQVRVARTSDGHYDFDDLIARLSPKADTPPSDPARFALYNLQVRDAQVWFDDRPVKRLHKIEALHLALPFISNLPAEVEIKVEPHLAFKLNGTPFDSGAQATPFAQTRNGEVKLSMNDMDLVPYLGYLPASLPVRVTRGKVSADLNVSFSMPAGSPPRVAVKGSVGAKNLALTDAGGQPLVAWQGLKLGLRDVQPLARKAAFEGLRIDGLQLTAVRNAAGQINLLSLAAGDAPPPVAAEAASAASQPQAAASRASGVASNSASTTPPAWQISLDAFDLADARVLWNDATVKPDAALMVDGLGITAKQIQWPIGKPIQVALKGALRSQALVGQPAVSEPAAARPATPKSASPKPASKQAPPAPAADSPIAEFSAEGPVTDREAKLDLKVTALSLGAFSPYLAQTLVPTVDGQVGAQAQLDWSGDAAAPRLRLAIDNVTLDALKMREGSGRTAVDALTLKQLTLGDVKVDLLARSVDLGSVKLMQPSIVVARDKAGRLNVQDWMVGAAKPSVDVKPVDRKHFAAEAPAASAPDAAASGAWHFRVKDLSLDNGDVRFTDAMQKVAKAEPLRVVIANLRIAAQGIEWEGERSTPPINLQLSARVGPPQRDKSRLTGLLEYKGRLGMQPLLANGKVHIDRFPLHMFAPYFADQIQLTLLRAEVGYNGNVAMRQLPAGLDLNAGGDVMLSDVHIASLPDPGTAAGAANTDELLTWQALSLKRVKVSMKPKAKPQFEIGESALSDFYSRLIVTEQGRFNLQDVTGRPAPVVGAAGAASGADAGRPAVVEVAAAASAASSPADDAVPAAPVTTTANASAGLPIDIKIGPTKLTNGRIDFTDHFVRPNYSAALTELNGQLGAFSSSNREMATLSLRGRAEGTALLEIVGQVNPTTKPLALDINAKATDLELAPLSPYAGKYVGYAIERGKLSMDVTYKIDADGKLDAKNQVVLNQLTFGDKIESKDATKLPVLLAVALLKDRNGVIDINLPVSGSINDPKFSVGGIIVKVILNLLTKALTAPFALFSGGGSDDLSVVEFQPGTAAIAPSSTSVLDKVAKALTERPALKMTVTGAADPVSERDAFQHAAIESRLNAERRREVLRSDPPDASASAPPPMSADEHTRLLKQVYKNTDIPNKPRNVIGLAKDIPDAEMETLLKTRTPVTPEAVRELALQRGIAVRDALIAKGLPSERLFLAAPKLRDSGEGDAAWTPKVQLTLSAN